MDTETRKVFSIAAFALIIAFLAIYSSQVAQNTVNSKANKTTWTVEIWIMGTDSDKNITMNYTFVPNSTEVYVNGISKDLFRDYNESGRNISVTAPLSYLDEVKVKYAEQ